MQNYNDDGSHLLTGGNNAMNNSNSSNRKGGKGVKRKSGLIGLGDEQLKHYEMHNVFRWKFDTKLKHEKNNRGGKRRKTVTNTMDEKAKHKNIGTCFNELKDYGK